jgi:hypothetical protein
MVQIETYLDRIRAHRPGVGSSADMTALGPAVALLDGAIARFESSLQGFASTTKDFHEFNAHLKDNVQRLSLTFADMNDSLKAQVGAIGPSRKG